MSNRCEMKKGTRVRYYNGTWYEIRGYATHTEKDEELIIYQRTDIQGNLWAKPLALFLAEAPTENNPTCQRYLFMSGKELNETHKQIPEIDGIKIYRLSENALKHYRENARNGKDAPVEVVERRLSAMISLSTMNPNKKMKIPSNIILAVFE